MNTTPSNDNALREQGEVGKTNNNQRIDHNALADLFPESLIPIARSVNTAHQSTPIITGQCAEVLELIRKHQPLLSFVLTADHAIPEAAARVHDLRAMGFNIRTTIVCEVEFRGTIRRKAAFYSIGMPEWPAPGFQAKKETA